MKYYILELPSIYMPKVFESETKIRKEFRDKNKSNFPFSLSKKNKKKVSCSCFQVKMFRSKSCREDIRSSSSSNKYHCFSHGGKSVAETAPNQTKTNQQPPVMQRSYSTTTSYSPHKNPTMVRDSISSKSKRSNDKVKKGSKSLCEAEIQRKKRVAAYNVYAVEGKVKGTMRKSFKWFKETCSNAVYGLW